MQLCCNIIIFAIMLQKVFLLNNGFSDKLSIAASVACAIHCVLLPLMFTTLPFFGIDLIENFFLEFVTVLISLLIGGLAIWKGYKKYHRNKLIPVLFIVGIALLVISNHVHGKNIEISLKFSGAAILVITHICNLRKCKNCALGKKHSNTNGTSHSSDSYQIERFD